MFSRSGNVAHPAHFDAAPNTLVDPVVAALPGALPVMNRRAVEMAMKVGLALDCEIAPFSKWDRKNYFYPDLPKGYQISQYDLPLCRGGQLVVPDAEGTMHRVGIIRAHLEEDTGKLGHELPGGFPCRGSLVDLNRAGTPLLEIVTQPDLASAEVAVTFARELRTICRTLGVSECVMQRGHIRFEPNVNVIITDAAGREHATPIVEIKNLNSFRAIRDAIDFEHRRQVEAWGADGIELAPGRKSTRGWDDARQVTVLQRAKEEAHDYRYFPDPDLPPVVVDGAWRRAVAGEIPELPMARRRRYRDEHGLAARDAEALTEEPDLTGFYERCVERVLAGGSARLPEASQAAAKLLLNAGARRANERGVAIHEIGIHADQVAGIIALRQAQAVGSSAADELFGLLCETEESAAAVAQRRGLLQVSDEGELDAWCARAVAAQPQAAADYRAGKAAALGRLVGEVMKLSGGRADAAKARERLARRLTE
jgi:aspartyl-tRNA(Asn)/glutamyl-tRNA(Gln) amidotransferase subunit B